MKKSSFIFVFIIVLFYGCTPSGFDQGIIKSSINYDLETTDFEIKRILDLKPQLTKPFRLAIYLDQKALDWSEKKIWRWVDEDRDSLFSAFQQCNNSLISDAFFIPGSMVGSGTLKEIRTAAARHNADAVLVIRGVSESDTYGNFWSWTYATIIMGWIVPGTEVDTYFKMSAALWDVRNEYLYCTSEFEDIKSFSSAGFLTYENKREKIQESKRHLYKKMLNDLNSRIKNMVSK